jgi:hypothetical protein
MAGLDGMPVPLWALVAGALVAFLLWAIGEAAAGRGSRGAPRLVGAPRVRWQFTQR